MVKLRLRVDMEKKVREVRIKGKAIGIRGMAEEVVDKVMLMMGSRIMAISKMDIRQQMLLLTAMIISLTTPVVLVEIKTVK